MSLKYLIVFDYSTNQTTETLTRIFEILWKNGLINVHVLIQNEFDIWSLVTFFPYRSDCTKLDHIRVATFTPMNFTEHINISIKNLYPEKLKNFNNCSIFVAPTESAVFVMRDTSNGIDEYRGVDIDIIKQIGKTLNFGIEYKRTDKHGDFFDNGTLTGSIQLVLL